MKSDFFVRTILEINADERASVLQYALPIISPQMDTNAKEQLIQLANHPDSSLSERMLRFITPEIVSSDSFAIIKAIAKIPIEQREDVLVCVESLVTENMYVFSRRP